MPALPKPPETNTRPAGRRIAPAVLLAALSAAPAVTQPPSAAPAAEPPDVVEVLAPRFFPTWQARNVAFPFVVFDPARREYRMYYAGSGAAQFNASAWDLWMTGVATSRDGLRWSFPADYEPVLRGARFADGDVVEPARRARFDALGAFGASVVREGPRHLMWYTGWSGDDAPAGEGRALPTHLRIGHATSRDGLAWSRVEGDAGLGSVLGLGPDGGPESQAVGQPFVVRDGAGYRMWYEAHDGREWRICSARSADGRAWTREGVALEPGGPGAPDERGARNPVVLRRRGRWELWYQGTSRGEPSSHVLRATSADGRTWARAGTVALPLRPALRPGERLHADSVIVRPDGSCRVFFAREKTLRRRVTWGEATSPSFHIYTTVIDP